MSSYGFSTDSLSGGGGIPTFQFNNALSWGDVGNVITDAGGQILDSGVSAVGDALVNAIEGAFKQNTGSQGSIAVQAGAVQGLAGLLEYCKSNAPPANNASQAERGNWVRYAVTAVLGIPTEVVWKDNQTKTDAYELFRAYLGTFDQLTQGRYAFMQEIPPHSGTCGNTPCSDSEAAYPYNVYVKLQQIGQQGLQAIDAQWNGQGLDSSTVEYLTDSASSTGDTTNTGGLLDAFKSAGQNLVDTLTSVITSTLGGAAAGAQASTAGAATGARAGVGALLGSPIVLALLVVAGVYLWKRR